MVAPPSFAAEYPVKPSAGSRGGAHERTASGAIIANKGEKKVAMTVEDGQVRMLTFHVADATKPLTPSRRIAAKGHRIVLGD